ncbi:hypothetical protein CAPTEDRAFT_188445 [Capitella teleta]|uniref:Elongator complex protein 5 n=1 Tax=Capitella teleta TaxID=283909 RepID=R7UDQ7_CAPTE|nr:hypothetical protein CAPTEDRAFT_188445 [Capitella teleta]|eukprot:ELU04241.1 hypothetical protein CAPTEDRAFT_188445 [Capitella teleta]
MLKEIIRGQEKAPIVMIEDNLDSSGVPLLRSFIRNMSQNVKLHLVTYEYNPQSLLCDFDSSAVQLHSVGDPLQWDGPAALHLGTDLHQYFESLPHSNEEFSVVIDCISRPIHHKSTSHMCRQIGMISRLPKLSQIVFMIHSDLHEMSTTCLLEHTASTGISILPLIDQTYTGLCSVLHKRQSGKITRLKEHYMLNASFDVIESEEFKPISQMLNIVSDAQPNPAANLTFNLSLSDKEKQDRSQLVLPYVHNKLKSNEGQVQISGAGAKIFYQPDEADDFDEEDPDEDLDI